METSAIGAGGLNATESYAGIRGLLYLHHEVVGLFGMSEARAMDPSKRCDFLSRRNDHAHRRVLRQVERLVGVDHPVAIGGVDVDAHVLILAWVVERSPAKFLRRTFPQPSRWSCAPEMVYREEGPHFGVAELAGVLLGAAPVALAGAAFAEVHPGGKSGG